MLSHKRHDRRRIGERRLNRAFRSAKRALGYSDEHCGALVVSHLEEIVMTAETAHHSSSSEAIADLVGWTKEMYARALCIPVLMAALFLMAFRRDLVAPEED